MYEVLHHYLPEVHKSDVLARNHLCPQSFFVVSCHREENVDESPQLERFVFLLNRLAEEYGQKIIVSVHPRTRKHLTDNKAAFHRHVDLLPAMGFFDYVQLELNAIATLSDSGTISEESSILGFPAINLREAHERPEGMEEAAVMMTGFDQTRVIECLRILSGQSKEQHCVVQDYQAPSVSSKVVRIIHSYVNYVNSTVWRR